MADFKKYSIEDLQKEIAEKRAGLREFRFNQQGSRTRNVREGRNLRKDIARLLTEVNARLASASKNG